MKKFTAFLVTVILFLSSAYAESATGALQEIYAQGELLMVQGDYAGAAAKFDALGTYSDASQMTMYCKAIAAAENVGLYSMAVDAFVDLGDFKDSKQMAKYYEGRAHEAAGMITVATASDSALDKALWQLEEAEKVYGGLAFFKDSLTRYGACGAKIKEIKGEQNRRAQIEREKELARMEGVYQEALTLEQNGDYAGAIKLYQSIKGYKDSAERIVVCETAILDGKYDAAVALMEAGKYSEAIEAFKAIKDYKDSAERITECKYADAVALMEAGKYSEAIAAFEAIRDYKDSAAKIKECETAILYNATVGTYITFGSYEQDNNIVNCKEDIEWLVLAIENDRLLVISRYALDCKPYNDESASVTWETCTLRTWLNDDFFNTAFNSEEQAMIPTVTVSADNNPEYSTDSGKATQDKVFLLSIMEADKFFKTDGARQCKPTAYAETQRAWKYKNGFCHWWVRSPGHYNSFASHVRDDGYVSPMGGSVDTYSKAVRPAMWINLAP